MVCQTCQREIKTTGFRLSFRLKCWHCGAQYDIHQKCLNPKQARVWHIGLFAFVFLNSFLARYISSHHGKGLAILVSLCVMLLFFFGFRRFKPHYQTLYQPIIPIDAAIARADLKALLHALVLAALVTVVVVAFV